MHPKQTPGTVHRLSVYVVSHCWGREFSFDYALLIISAKIASARSP